MTFDAGWRARLDGAPLATYPTAACQLGVELPAGEHRLDLELPRSAGRRRRRRHPRRAARRRGGALSRGRRPAGAGLA